MKTIARRMVSGVTRLAVAAIVAAACSTIVLTQSLTITGQGGRPFGGRVMGEAATGSLHCDHGLSLIHI